MGPPLQPRQGDKEKGRQGERPPLLVSLSPCLLVETDGLDQDQWLASTCSPPERETREATTTGESESRRKETWPSPNSTLAPPVWKAKISSLGPQLLTSFQLQL